MKKEGQKGIKRGLKVLCLSMLTYYEYLFSSMGVCEITMNSNRSVGVDMTKRECAVLMAYTGIALLIGDDLKYFYDYCSELLGRPMFTHEYPEYAEKLKELSKKDVEEIFNNLST